MSGKKQPLNKSSPKSTTHENKSITENHGQLEADGKRQIIHQRIEMSGPLPPPAILQGYEEICPGAADRIISMAESQSLHRQQIEKAFIISRNKQSSMGTVIAGLILLTAIGCGTFLLLNDKNLEAFGLMVSTALPVIGTTIYGKTEQRKQMSEKEDD